MCPGSRTEAFRAELTWGGATCCPMGGATSESQAFSRAKCPCSELQTDLRGAETLMCRDIGNRESKSKSQQVLLPCCSACDFHAVWV